MRLRHRFSFQLKANRSSECRVWQRKDVPWKGSLASCTNTKVGVGSGSICDSHIHWVRNSCVPTKTETKKGMDISHIICPQKLSVIGERLDFLFGDSHLTSLWIRCRGDATGLLPLQRRLSDLCTRCDGSLKQKNARKKDLTIFHTHFQGIVSWKDIGKSQSVAGWSRFCVGGLCVATAWALGTLS